jgi:hypothetical protein
VSHVDAGPLQLLDLSQSLALDVVLSYRSAQQCLYEVEERRTKRLPIGPEQGGNALRMRDGDAIGQDYMAANTKGLVGMGDGHGMIERSPVGHEGGGGQNMGLMKLGDGAIDARGEAEVVRVDDEASSHLGLSRSR